MKTSKCFAVLIIPSFLIIGINAISQTSYNDNARLIEYHENNGNFIFLSVTNPKIDKIKQNTSDGSSYFMHIYSYSFKGYSFSATYYPIIYQPLNIANEDQLLLDNMVAGAAKNVDGSIEYSNEISYRSYPGREYLISYSYGKIKSRLFIINRKVYLLSVENQNDNLTFNSDVVINFFNSFSISSGNNSFTKSVNKSSEKLSPEIHCSDIEFLLLSSIETIDEKLKSRGWTKLQELYQDKFGKGYQYIYEPENGLFQLIIYPEVNALIYVPDENNYKIFETEVKNKYSFDKTEYVYGQKQHVYKKSKIRIHLNPDGAKKMITAFWNISE